MLLRKINDHLKIGLKEINLDAFLANGGGPIEFTVVIDEFNVNEQYMFDLQTLAGYKKYINSALELRGVFTDVGNAYLFLGALNEVNFDHFVEVLLEDIRNVADKCFGNRPLVIQDVKCFLLELEAVGWLTSSTPHELYLDERNSIDEEDIIVDIICAYEQKEGERNIEPIELEQFHLKNRDYWSLYFLFDIKIPVLNIEPLQVYRTYASLSEFKQNTYCFVETRIHQFVKTKRFSLLDKYDLELIKKNTHWFEWVAASTNHSTIKKRFAIHYELYDPD